MERFLRLETTRLVPNVTVGLSRTHLSILTKCDNTHLTLFCHHRVTVVFTKTREKELLWVEKDSVFWLHSLPYGYYIFCGNRWWKKNHPFFESIKGRGYLFLLSFRIYSRNKILSVYNHVSVIKILSFLSEINRKNLRTVCSEEFVLLRDVRSQKKINFLMNNLLYGHLIDPTTDPI